MRFQTSEPVRDADTEVVLSLLEAQLRRISWQVERSEQAMEACDIRASFSSIVQNSTAVLSIQTNKANCLLTADVSYRPSVAFWFFFGLGLPTALGWLIPLAFYMSQKGTIRSTIEDVLRRVKAECEFNDSSVAEEVRSCQDDAENGVVEAQVRLADAYYDGDGVPQDFAEATRWTRKAAEQGDSSAQYNLGLAYYTGEGVPQDYAEAALWYRRAAEQGDESAQANLELMHERGQV